MSLEKYRLVEKQSPVRIENGLHSGCTLLNLACTGNPSVGFFPGKYYFIVGDSSSGKTFLSMSCFAEAAKNPKFENYRLIYDDVEGGNLFDLKRLFGKKTARRIETPSKDSMGSSTIEEFYFNAFDAVKKGVPFIYVLDSMDGLSSEAEIEKFEENRKKFAKGSEMSGSYGDGKAKKNSANMRRLMRPLQESGSILIVISQTRDNIGFGFEQKTRSGGRALKFYACLEIWSSVKGRIKKKVNGIDRQQGVRVQVKVKKNRINGSAVEVEFPIYPSYGIDDISANIQYMVKEGAWKKTGATINATEFEMIGTEQKIVSFIEQYQLQKELAECVGEVWAGVQDQLTLKRKPRYE